MSTLYGDPQYDLRILERSLREGKMTRKEVEQYLKNLPDESKQAKEIVLQEEPQKGTAPDPAPKSPTFALAEG